MISIQPTLELHRTLVLECTLSNCNWVNRAHLKQPWSIYSVVEILYDSCEMMMAHFAIYVSSPSIQKHPPMPLLTDVFLTF